MKRDLRGFLWLLLLPTTLLMAEQHTLDAPKCDYGLPAKDAPAEFAQFAFLIGDYTIEGFGWFNNRWYANPNAKVPPRWNGYYGLKGDVIIDEWFNEDPAVSPDTNRGINVRMFDAESGEWKMMWVSDFNHVAQDLRAKVIDGKLTMWQVYPERPDFRAEFEVEDDNTWHRIEYTKDENNNWIKRFKLTATRIPCP